MDLFAGALFNIASPRVFYGSAPRAFARSKSLASRAESDEARASVKKFPGPREGTREVKTPHRCAAYETREVRNAIMCLFCHQNHNRTLW